MKTLPAQILSETVTQDPSAALGADTCPSTPSSQGKRRILVVDDSHLQRRLVIAALRGIDAEIREAASGEQALIIARSWVPDIVICDWMMPPGIPGPEVCRRFRALGLSRYSYFILVTSKSAKEDIAEGLDAGADDFLAKPVSKAELQARLRAGIRILEAEERLIERNRKLQETLEELEGLYKAISRDLHEARRLQLSLVPQEPVELPRARIDFLLEPSGHVGGDLVGWFQASESMIGLYSVDVSGHGVGSALLTARIAAYLSPADPRYNIALLCDRSGACRPRSPADTAAILNTRLLEDVETDLYFTMSLVVLDLSSGQGRLVQAGHPPLLIADDAGRWRQVGEGGMPIGLLEGATWEEVPFRLGMNEALLLHSDGITECPLPDGSYLDDVSMAKWLAGRICERRGDFRQHLLTALQGLAGAASFPDDVSALLFRWQGQSQ